MVKVPQASGARRSLDLFGSPALGFVELSSISRGLYLTDTVLKKADVKIIVSQPISSGKYVILYMGDVASVEESHLAALELADGTAVRDILIPSVHGQLVPFLETLWVQTTDSVPSAEAVGIVESNTLAGAILAADRALKTADVRLCRMRLGLGIGGKAYFVLSGAQHEVEASLAAAQACLQELNSLCRVDCIPRPELQALAYF